jgi:hypothetical protein
MWMDEVSEWIAGLATPGNMLYFILGFFTSPVLYWGWCMTKHRKFYVNWRYLGIALGIAVMLFISIQTQVAYNIAAQTAQDTKACQAEFQAAIKGSREVTTENDELSVKQRNLLAEKDRAETEMWLRLLDPPYPIAELEASDPQRQSYGLQVVREYATKASEIDAQVRLISQRQVELQESRPALPEPTCGK